MIKCNDIPYRQGYIEVTSGVHPNHINVEIWNIHPDQDISDQHLNGQAISDKDIVGNTEIELSILQATLLIKALKNAINFAERGEVKIKHWESQS